MTREKWDRARRRRNRFLFKRGTEKVSILTNSKAFHRLPPGMLPNLGPGYRLYRSHKTGVYKLRRYRRPTIGADFSPESMHSLTLYQSPSTQKLAYNMQFGGNTLTTLAQGDTDKTSNPTGNKKVRSDYGGWGLPDFKAGDTGETFVRGHGQPRQVTMPRVGSGPTSDASPENYTGENPYWGEQVRRRLEYKMIKDKSQFVERNRFGDRQLVGGLSIPEQKDVTTFDSSNQPQHSYSFPQVHDYKADRASLGSMDAVIASHEVPAFGNPESYYDSDEDVEMSEHTTGVSSDPYDYLSDDE